LDSLKNIYIYFFSSCIDFHSERDLVEIYYSIPKYEKAFSDLGSGFVMKAFIDWHKKYIEWWKKKLKISNYGIVWISFIKGLIIGLLIYHFFII